MPRSTGLTNSCAVMAFDFYTERELSIVYLEGNAVQ